jgi:FdhD protein
VTGEFKPALDVVVRAWPDSARRVSRCVPAEVPVAITFDRVTFAVMMASPADLEDFAVGFAISEEIVRTPDEIVSLTVETLAAGIECRLELAPAQRDALEVRRRRMAGPVGCGLCGIDSLVAADRALPVVTSPLRVTAAQVAQGLAAMPALQLLNAQTRGVHAAGFFIPADGSLTLREDVGRHNALDKVIGAAARAGAQAATGFVVMTSRVSVELVQKTAIFGCPLIAAVSVPTSRAIAAANAAGMTLIAVGRDDGFEVFSHAGRIDTQSMNIVSDQKGNTSC